MRRPAARRGRRGVHQQLADVRVGLRAALEQVAGDDVGVRAAGHQRACGLAVQALALGSGEVLLDRGGDQAVGQALAVGTEQAGGEQRVAGRGQLADGDAGDGRHHVRERAVAEDRERGGHRPVAGRQRGQPPADDVAGDRRDGRRVVAGVGRSRPARASRSAGPARPAATGCRRPRDGSRGTPPPGSRAPARRMSCAAPRGVSRCGCSTVADRAPPSRLSRSDGARGSSTRRADGDQQRQVVDPPRQVGEHLQRGAVGPLGVVDHERERALLGERGAQPQHAVGDEHRRVPAGTVPSSSSVPAGAAAPSSSCARSSSEASRSGASSSARTTPKGKWRSSGPGAARRTRQPASAGGRRGVLEQRRLAQARGRVEHDHPAVARRPGSGPLRRAPRSRPRAR